MTIVRVSPGACFEIRIGIYCWIISTTGTTTLQGQGSWASLTSPTSWKQELVGEVILYPNDHPAVHEQTIDQIPMQSKGLKADAPLNHMIPLK